MFVLYCVGLNHRSISVISSVTQYRQIREVSWLCVGIVQRLCTALQTVVYMPLLFTVTRWQHQN